LVLEPVFPLGTFSELPDFLDVLIKDSWPNWPSYQLRSLTKMGGSTTANGMLNLFVSTIKKAQHSLNHRMSPLENLTFLGSGIFDVQRNQK